MVKIINENLGSDSSMCDKFKKVYFSSSLLGLKTMGVSPYLQSFIYKTFCLSNFTYGLEQNNIIRQIVGLLKYCRI